MSDAATVRAPHGSRDRPTEVGRPLLEVRDVAKSYGAVQALRSASIAVHAGEVVGLLGDNGAGKSTLVKIISGSLRPDSGSVRVDGVPVEQYDPEVVRRLGVETVFQDLALADLLDVAANLHLNREIRHRWPILRAIGWLDKRRMASHAHEVLQGLGITLPSVRARVETLSGGQRQAVAVGRAAAWGSKVVIMDEPTAALGVEQSRLVLQLVERLRDAGLGVIVVSHNMQEVMGVCDRAVVLLHGEIAGDVSIPDSTPEDLVALITGAHSIRWPA